MDETLDARVLIVGGTGGIGRALAERHASLGGDIVITSRDAGRAEATAADIGDNVQGIAPMLADVGEVATAAGPGRSVSASSPPGRPAPET